MGTTISQLQYMLFTPSDSTISLDMKGYVSKINFDQCTSSRSEWDGGFLEVLKLSSG